MARNDDLLRKILNKYPSIDSNLTRLFPFHLATSYMDGAKTCCNIVDLTVHSLAGPNLIKNLYVNDLGYTVLDNLMISILKAHTSCFPVTVDDRQKLSKRFAGEEVDICGRWDADSPCVRTLLAHGKPTIPFSWKHMFCHTSAQTICHSIAIIFSPSHAPDINTLSGLFAKVCENCNYKLQVGPLHCLVLTAFYLAQSGCEDENLFGILACLVCLLVHGADPLQKAEISIKALLGTDDGNECSHISIDPVELADQVPEVFMATWTDEVKLGWQVTTRVLRFAQQERSQIRKQRSQGGAAMGLHYNDESEAFIDRGGDSDDVMTSDQDSDEVEDDGHGGLCEHQYLENFYGKSKDLGTLWASIQTELLTYRRIKEGDPWISNNFSMRSLLDGLDAGAGFSFVPLVDQKMMKPFCKCGRFLGARDESCARVTEVSAFYFSNLEDWERSNYIPLPDQHYW